jgi:entericidin A
MPFSSRSPRSDAGVFGALPLIIEANGHHCKWWRFMEHRAPYDEKGTRMTERSKTGKLLIAMLIGAVFTLSACATVKGLGRDIESVGQAGSDAINR